MQAEREFVRCHRSKGWLSPGRFVLSEEHEWSKVLIPFWIFEGTFNLKYKCEIGHKDYKGNLTHWEKVPWSSIEAIKLPNEHPSMQVCGSFAYRHDFVEMLKGNHLPRLQPLEQFLGTAIDTDLQRGFAWTFVLRNVVRTQEGKLGKYLEARYADCLIKGIKLRAFGLPNDSKLVYVPAYVVNYVYGEKINVHGERIPNEFYGMVSAFGGQVATNNHISVKKSSIFGGITAAAAMEIASLCGYSTALGWSMYDYLFISTGAAATCGLFSQVIPGIIRQNEEQEILSRFDDDATFASMQSCDSLHESEIMENDRNLREWARWEQGSRDPCDHEKRKNWAESLWKSHMNRLKSMRQVFAGKEEHERKRRDEEQRRLRREARWGPQDKSQHPQHIYKRDPDFLGFYKILGLDPTNLVTQHDIKQQFYKRVLRYHPDKHKDSAEKLEAKRIFQQLIRAYEVLKHPSSRKKYDSGEYRE